MWGFLAGVVLGVIGAALTPWVKHLVPQPGRRKIALERISRAMVDHQHWLEQANAEMAEELHRIDGDLAKRGILDSSIRIQEHERVKRRFEAERGAQFRQVLRVSDDARGEMGPVERWWTKRRLGKEDPSLEEIIFGEPEI